VERVCLYREGAGGRPLKYCELLDYPRHCQVLKMDSAPWIELVLCSETDRADSRNVLSSDVTDCCVFCVSVQQNCLTDCPGSLYQSQLFSCLALRKARSVLRVMFTQTVIYVLCAVLRTDPTLHCICYDYYLIFIY
jgi:hypothetical protein